MFVDNNNITVNKYLTHYFYLSDVQINNIIDNSQHCCMFVKLAHELVRSIRKVCQYLKN